MNAWQTSPVHIHPAVIRLINKTIQDAHAKGKWVGLCGEMAGDELAAPLLLGLGLDEFSMAHTSVPCIKYLMRMLNKAECEKIASRGTDPSFHRCSKELYG